MSYRRTGINPLSYMGVEPVTLSADVAFPRAPTNNDINFNLSTRWLDNSEQEVWILVNLDAGIATWVKFAGNTGSVTELTGNTGGAVPPLDGNINIVGSIALGITVSGNPGTNTLTILPSGGFPIGQSLTGDAGGLVPFDATGNIDTLGAHGINTLGNPALSTMTFAINNAITLGDLTPVSVSLTLQTGALEIVNGDAIIGNVEASALASSVEFEKSRVGGVITSGDDLGSVAFRGHDGTTYITGASIVSETTGTIAANRIPANLQFLTHPDSATGPLQRVVIETTGTVTVNEPDSGDAIEVIGGDVALDDGNLLLTDTDATGETGVIEFGGFRYISNFGERNFFLGEESGSTTLATANDSVGVGYHVLQNLTGIANANVAVGNFSMELATTARANTAIGHDSLGSLTSGDSNVAVGYNALFSVETGTDNVAVGNGALLNLVGAASENTAIGDDALGALTAGNTNTALGNDAGASLTTTDSNNIHISNPGIPGENNTIKIGISGAGGGQQNRCFIAGIRGITTGVNDAIAVLIDSAGQLGTVSSTRRVKEDIKDMGSDSNGIMNLRPVSFIYKNDEKKDRQWGLIAEEVNDIMPRLVVKDKNDDPETVKYHDLSVLLLNELQNQYRMMSRLHKRLKILESEMSDLM